MYEMSRIRTEMFFEDRVTDTGTWHDQSTNADPVQANS